MNVDEVSATNDFPHGSPAGFAQGCRSAGGCLHHGSAVYLTCKEAASARASDWGLSKLPMGQPILRAAIKIPRTPPRSVATESSSKKLPRAPRTTAVKAARPQAAATTPAAAAPEHGTLAGYWNGECFREDLCPADPSCAQVNLTHVAGTKPPHSPAPHGTLFGYWVAGCVRDADCPNSPTCAQVNLIATTVPTRERNQRPPKASKAPRAKREPVHGSVWGYRLGCVSETECPNLSKGGPSCAAAYSSYYRDYRASRRAGNGPPIKHGTPSGYQHGCHGRDSCPRDDDGISCADASLAEERRRRREAGRPEQRPLVDAQPTRDHVAFLRSRGMGIVSIARAAGVSKTGLRALVYGREDFTADGGRGPRHGEIPKRIDQEKAESVLTVVPFNPRSRSNAVHGTRNGYRRFECRSQTECPSAVEGGISCSEASSNYQQGVRERSRAVHRERSA